MLVSCWVSRGRVRCETKGGEGEKLPALPDENSFGSVWWGGVKTPGFCAVLGDGRRKNSWEGRSGTHHNGNMRTAVLGGRCMMMTKFCSGMQGTQTNGLLGR